MGDCNDRFAFHELIEAFLYGRFDLGIGRQQGAFGLGEDHFGFFQELKDMRVFNSVKPVLGSVQWKDGQDFCPDTLYLDSKPIVHLSTTKSKPSMAEQLTVGALV